MHETLNKLKNYNDTGRNLPSPPPGGCPPPWIPPPNNYNNNINNYNDDEEDDDFPPHPSFSPYSSHMPPSNNIPEAPLIFTPPQTPTSGCAVLERAQEKSIEERPVEEESL